MIHTYEFSDVDNNLEIHVKTTENSMETIKNVIESPSHFEDISLGELESQVIKCAF